jgi:hypothetical protein
LRTCRCDRNWDDLLALVPGQGDRYTEQGGGTSFGRTGGINVRRSRAPNNFLLDGVDNSSISENVRAHVPGVRPSVDAIQEFKVVTSPLCRIRTVARRGGGVSTKSGTNGIRGTAAEYFRNDAMDSIDYFSQKAMRRSRPTIRISTAATSAARS